MQINFKYTKEDNRFLLAEFGLELGECRYSIYRYGLKSEYTYRIFIYINKPTITKAIDIKTHNCDLEILERLKKWWYAK